MKRWIMDRAGSAAKERHASFLELDRAALGIELEHGVTEHVKACARCHAAREAIEERQRAHRGEMRVPEWVMVLAGANAEQGGAGPKGDTRSVDAGGWLARLRSAQLGAPIGVRLGAVALGAAALAGSWLVLRAAVERDGSDARTSYYVGAKGAPGVGVYVKRGAHVFAWNGTEAIRAGDLLRLGVAAGNYRFIAVCSRSREGLITLYRGELRGNGELPVAWAVDDAGDAERLIVVLSERPLSDHEVRAEAAAPRGSSAVWSRELVLPKHAARSGSAGAAP